VVQQQVLVYLRRLHFPVTDDNGCTPIVYNQFQ
jgi:hypothetical protein